MPEKFETFDASGARLGLTDRDIVHREGLWHRATNVFLFRTDGSLVIQRRQLTKDVCPGLWDVSVAEHLQPGEDFHAGAIRGLQEELGLTGIEIEPVGNTTEFTLELPELGIRDCELQQSFRAVSDATCRVDPVEVAEVREVSQAELMAWMDQRPESFTPWFRNRLAALSDRLFLDQL